MCEGDDYWIDPLKLQKQVDFLESHIEYGMIYSNAKIYSQDREIFLQYSWGNKKDPPMICYFLKLKFLL